MSPKSTTRRPPGETPRLYSVSYDDGLTPTVFYACTRRGRLTEVARGSEAWKLFHNTNGQILSEAGAAGAVNGLRVTNAFDELLRRTKAGGDSSGGNLRSASYTANNLNQITQRDVPAYLNVIGAATATATNVNVNDTLAYRRGEYYRVELNPNNASSAVWQSVTNRAVQSGTTHSVTGNLFLPKHAEAFSYDADGNLANDGRWTYVGDGENRLVRQQDDANAGLSFRVGRNTLRVRPMHRRRFLKSVAAIPLIPIAASQGPANSVEAAVARTPARRVRPGDRQWPSEESWNELKKAVEGRLAKVESPLVACQKEPGGAACQEILKRLKNPYYIGDQPALTQTSGWVDAWVPAPSVYAVAAARAEDVVAAVNFARENNLRLVVKGGGHSYLGTSNAADSLLVWTRAMNSIVVHDAFVAQGCAGKQAPQPAVTVGAGAIWMQAYDAVTTRAGRYVQGGGCTTVGVAGLVQSGGFGSFSKNYGMAAAGLLEAEIVTADGTTRIANACVHPDLFWAIKGGGGGSLGVVTNLTLRTRELPDYFGGVFGTIKARSDAAFRRLTAHVIRFYHERLFNRHWGEQIALDSANRMRISMVFQGLNRQQAENVWQPFIEWVTKSPEDFTIETPLATVDIAARHFWDAAYMKQNHPQFIVADDRPGAPEGNVYWRGDGGQVGHFLHGYRSAWVPASLLKTEAQSALANALFASSRHWGVSLHFNKGMAGAPVEELEAARDTAMNPAVLDAFALAIIATGGPPAFPGIPGGEPDLTAARRHARAINNAMDELLKVIPDPGSYVSESDFFERSWQRSYWGSNYPRLAAAKRKYDPDGLFFAHHGVGSEEWSADGFTRLVGR